MVPGLFLCAAAAIWCQVALGAFRVSERIGIRDRLETCRARLLACLLLLLRSAAPVCVFVVAFAPAVRPPPSPRPHSRCSRPRALAAREGRGVASSGRRTIERNAGADWEGDGRREARRGDAAERGEHEPKRGADPHASSTWRTCAGSVAGRTVSEGEESGAHSIAPIWILIAQSPHRSAPHRNPRSLIALSPLRLLISVRSCSQSCRTRM